TLAPVPGVAVPVGCHANGEIYGVDLNFTGTITGIIWTPSAGAYAVEKLPSAPGGLVSIPFFRVSDAVLVGQTQGLDGIGVAAWRRQGGVWQAETLPSFGYPQVFPESFDTASRALLTY